MGVNGRVSDEGELDGDVGIDADGGEYDIRDEEIGEGDPLGPSGSVSNGSVSNGSDSIKLKSPEWCDDRNDMLELKERGARATWW